MVWNEISPIAPGEPAVVSQYNTLLDNVKDNRLLIARTALTASAASISFPGIPQDFRNLELWWTARSTGATLSTAVFLRFNNTSSGHRSLFTTVQTTGISTSATTAGAEAGIGVCPGTSAVNGNYFSSGVAQIPNYRETPHYHNFTATCAHLPTDVGGDFKRTESVGFFGSVAAVTRLDLLIGLGNFAAGTSVSLYGLR